MSAWDEEVVPPRLVALGAGIRTAFSLPATAIGTKGDRSHTYGGHRSRRWIMEDGDGLDDYTVQLPLDQGGDANWISAIDATLNQQQMIATTGRLITAMKNRDPQVAQVRECYGTLDGRTVSGWDAAFMRAVTADSSHLWHIHLTLYRSMANHDHSGLQAVITGEDADMADLDTQIENMDRCLYMGVLGLAPEIPVSTGMLRNRLAETLTGLKTGQTELKAGQAADKARDELALAAIQGMASAGGPEAAPIVAAINEKSAELRALLVDQHTQEMAALTVEHDARVAALEAELAELRPAG